MFSSKQDLIDVIYMVPLFIFASIFIFVFDVNFSFLLNSIVIDTWSKFLYADIILLSLSLCIHIGIIVLVNLVLSIKFKSK